MLVSSSLPVWLQVLLAEKFFNACIFHEEERKNEKNIFCINCCVSICPHCLPLHQSHLLLQIRRYVYHDVLRLEDASRLVDCDLIQSYITNSAKVVFINQRPQSRQFRCSGNICITCKRNLQEPFLFCSISCKVNYIIGKQISLSEFLRNCQFLPLPDPSHDCGLMTPDSVLESAESTRMSGNSGGNGGVLKRTTVGCTATTDIVRKKRSSLARCRPAVPLSGSEGSSSLMNRRKKTPQRSPLL